MVMSTEETLRLTIGALMRRTGEAQGDLARALGQAQAQVSRKQSGRARWSLADVDLLAAHYQMPVLDLLAGPTHAAGRLPAHRLAATIGGAQTLLTTADVGATPPPPKRRRRPAPAVAPEPERPALTPEEPPPPVPTVPAPTDRDAAGAALTAPPAPCRLCGAATPYRAGGAPQHISGLCLATWEVEQVSTPAHPPAQPVDTPPPPPPAEAPAEVRPALGAGPLVDRIYDAVSASLTESGGDIDIATAALIKKTIPDAMALFAESRVGGRYEHSEFPAMTDLLKKKSQRGADQIFEGRQNWRHREYIKSSPGAEVTALDMNGAYLAAMKTHLPIGALKHDTSGVHNPRRSGIHLINPPEWEHDDMPSPLGDRKESGALWVTEATLRLLLRCARLTWCDAPVIKESWTSGSTESLLEKFRRTLAEAREKAIADQDELTLTYVKSMYAKFVSTIGQSSANRDIRRPDWMHIIRSQAFANLWLKAERARGAGLTVVQVTGTDELHVAGDWRRVFREGRGLAEVKMKSTYTI